MKTNKQTEKKRSANGFTPEQEAEIIRETEWTIKYGKRYTAEELFKELGV